MGGSSAGINFLLDAVEDIQINPRLLRELQVAERLQTNMSDAQAQRYAALLQAVAPPAEDIDQLINDRLRGYAASNFSVDKGKTHFSVYCGICHKVGEEGGNIGPQLDGVGNWGAQALAEKILDPNRNIFRAFTLLYHTLCFFPLRGFPAFHTSSILSAKYS